MMLTNTTTVQTNARPAQKVVIVNGCRETLQLLETVLEAGHYDIVFVESSQHAYSQIKRVQPHLVILYMRIDDIHGFQVLSMLKLDEETQRIPILTYTTEFEGEDPDEGALEASAAAAFVPKAAVRMN
jgi:PleD family two-component response regulator